MSRKVSIVVPAYNSEETIAETLRSLRSQFYDDLEVIVVNDGSKDRTGEIALQEAEESAGRIRVITQTNAGQAAALNRGWDLAKGDYIGYLSADDVLYPEAIAVLADALDRDDSTVVVYPDYDLIDAKSKLIRGVRAPDFSARQLIEESLCQPGPGALFRRTAYAKTGGWNPALRLTPDFDFWLRLSRHGLFERIPRSLAGFRVHEASQSFAAPSFEKSEEPANVISEFFKNEGGKRWNRSRAMAWAHTLSSRLHFRGGRLSPAFSHLGSALSWDPAILFRLRFWHLLASGLVGQLRYRLQASTK